MIINISIVINKTVSKIWKFSILQVNLFSLKFVGIVFVGVVFVTSLISSHLIAKSLIVLFKYLQFSQIHVLGFQKNHFHTHHVFLGFCTRILIYRYSSCDLSYTFFHLIYIYIHMMYV